VLAAESVERPQRPKFASWFASVSLRTFKAQRQNGNVCLNVKAIFCGISGVCCSNYDLSMMESMKLILGHQETKWLPLNASLQRICVVGKGVLHNPKPVPGNGVPEMELTGTGTCDTTYNEKLVDGRTVAASSGAGQAGAAENKMS
jgi:hypothetical protein